MFAYGSRRLSKDVPDSLAIGLLLLDSVLFNYSRIARENEAALRRTLRVYKTQASELGS